MQLRTQGAQWVPGLLAFAAAALFAVVIGFFSGIGGGHYAASLLLVVVVLGAVAWDCRIGAIALIVLLPLSETHLIPREMFGVTGLSPLNLLLVGTVIGYFVSGSKAFRPKSTRTMDSGILWFFVLPVLLAGANGMQHVDEVLPVFHENGMVEFEGPWEYLTGEVVKPLFFVAYAWLVSVLIRDSEKPERYLWPLLISALLMALVTIGGIALTGFSLAELAAPRARKTLAWLGMHNNDLGPMFVASVAIFLHAAGPQKAALRFWLLAAASMCALAAMLTFSRNAFLMLLIVLAGFFFGGKIGWRLSMGVVVLLLAALLLPREFVNRATTGIGQGSVMNADEDALTAGRVSGIWIPVLRDAVETPVFGAGIQAMLWSASGFNEETGDAIGHPHNAYLRLFLEMGVVGLALVLWFFWGLFSKARKLGSDPRLSPQEQAMAQAAKWALIAMAVQGLTGGAFTPLPSQVFVWCGIGFICGLHARANAPARAPEPTPNSARGSARGSASMAAGTRL